MRSDKRYGAGEILSFFNNLAPVKLFYWKDKSCMSQTQIICFACQHQWSFSGPLSRRDECPGCGNDARVCRNCKLYDQRAYRACKEDQAEWVKEKERANFCSYFAPTASSLELSVKNPRAELEALFSGTAPLPDPATSALKNDLEAFFSRRKLKTVKNLTIPPNIDGCSYQ